MSATITIEGVAVPVSDFEDIADTLISGIKAGKSPEDILCSVAPSLLPIAETIAGALIPYAGALISLAAFAYSKSIPFKDLPQEEQNAWFDRFGARGDSA